MYLRGKKHACWRNTARVIHWKITRLWNVTYSASPSFCVRMSVFLCLSVRFAFNVFLFAHQSDTRQFLTYVCLLNLWSGKNTLAVALPPEVGILKPSRFSAYSHVSWAPKRDFSERRFSTTKRPKSLRLRSSFRKNRISTKMYLPL